MSYSSRLLAFLAAAAITAGSFVLPAYAAPVQTAQIATSHGAR